MHLSVGKVLAVIVGVARQRVCEPNRMVDHSCRMVAVFDRELLIR
jgi:hypothetical protein